MTTELDLATVHRYFSATCFNAAWALVDKVDRTTADEQRLIETCYASLYHWRSREDCTDQNLSIGYWQLSRAHAVMGNGTEAKRAAEICLSHSENLEPFYLGYAYEALARAAWIAGDGNQAREVARQALAQAELVQQADHREMLTKDIQEFADLLTL